MTWDEAIRYLFTLERRGVKLDLERMRACLEELGRPQDAFPSVLVAGTNGKGSTAAILASVFSRPGRRVGLYTSPHLLDFRERIRLDGQLGTKEVLLERIERDRAVWERHELSFFEAATALAFSFFRQCEVGLAVLEVGLGGRLDATNTVEPVLSVVTALGMDHAHLLGGTAAAIAREKAGILRRGVPACLDTGAPEATAEVAARAAALGAPLYRRRDCLRVSDCGPGGFRLSSRDGSPGGAGLPSEGLRLVPTLPGIHQVRNVSLAVLASLLLRERGIEVENAEIARGVERLRWPGRLETPRPGLPLLADVAHNPEGARVLANHLRRAARGREIRPVVGMIAQKDHRGFFREISRVAARVRIAPLGTERSAPIALLEEAARAAGLEVARFPRVADALADALRDTADPEGPAVVLCGSFHTLEEGYKELGLGPLESLWDLGS